MKHPTICMICVALLLFSCTTLQEYEKVRLNDADMSLSNKKADRFKMNFHSYREAASGGNNGKTGGGCGCN